MTEESNQLELLLHTPSPRYIVWFSCGAASAVAAKLATEKFGDQAIVVYCDTSASEHPDNNRFFADVERWIGRKILRLKSEKYADIDDVFMKTRYMAGPQGARCTVEMKKMPRFAFQLPDDIHIFGFTSDETKRIADFDGRNFDLRLNWILRDSNVDKDKCYQIIEEAGIKLPVMYRLGYRNNNCLGCVKATSPGYWNKVRKDFPEVFQLRATQSRELGVRLTRVKGERIFLDELPEGVGKFRYRQENISCGPECGVPEVPE